MFKQLKIFRLWLSYKLSEMRNVYSHKAVSQQTGKNGETIILYTILGKRDIYRTVIKDLMDDNALLERFHPCQTVKFGAIALGDILFSLPHEKREQQYKKIKSQMLDSNEKENNLSTEDEG